jgi:hypothetical protein
MNEDRKIDQDTEFLYKELICTSASVWFRETNVDIPQTTWSSFLLKIEDLISKNKRSSYTRAQVFNEIESVVRRRAQEYAKDIQSPD